jgi:ABC-type uncharacterized transport system auxiliary subunit
MIRRRGLLGAGLLGGIAAAGCSVLPAAQYPQLREWPIVASRPDPKSARAGGPVLLVRSVTAAPGLERRGLQTVQRDGSMHVDFYEQWAVPPAEGVEAALREWLAGSGLFSAVIGSGSRLSADLALESELTRFAADPGTGNAEVSLAIALLDLRRGATRVRLQRTLTADAPLSGSDAPAAAHAILAALADVLGQAVQALATERA